MDDLGEFESQCLKHWGGPTRTPQQIQSADVPLVQQFVALEDASEALKTGIAAKLIRESTSKLGIYSGNSDIGWYIQFASDDIGNNPKDLDFRRLPGLRSGLLMAALSAFGRFEKGPDVLDRLLSGGNAMAAFYLFPQLEHLFRVGSNYLNQRGEITRPLSLDLLKQTGRKKRTGIIIGVEQAAKIFMYQRHSVGARQLRKLEREIGVSARLRLVRNPALHGETGDPGYESKFLALLWCLAFYGENSFADS
jgi:hypothetical protein